MIMKSSFSFSVTSCIFCIVIYAIVADTTINESKDIETNGLDRNRREVSDLNDLQTDDNTQSELVGKRLREFIGKRSAEGDAIDNIYPEDFETEKRLREFIGKREMDDDITQVKRMRDFIGKRSYYDSEMDKRMRDFVGKRPYNLGDMEKRQYEFIGKRNGLSDEADEFNTYDKRMRHFVGKRRYNFLDDLSTLEKRFREFVGKRGIRPEEFFRIQQRYVRKPQYVRELVGKRSSPDIDIDEDKRMRDFIGKRMRDFVGKRMRDFVGK